MVAVRKKKRVTKVFPSLLVSLFAGLVLLGIQTYIDQLPQRLPIGATVELSGEVIHLEVATTLQQQAKGLMYRTALPNNVGMLFVLDPPRSVQFWMKNVRIPLDMIFLNNGRVEAIAFNVPSCKTVACPTYGPSAAVDQVIELRGGRAEKLGLKVGDRAAIKILHD